MSSPVNPIDQIKDAVKTTPNPTIAPKPVSTSPLPSGVDVQQMMKDLLKLKEDLEADKAKVRLASSPAPKPPIDWSKITEADIIDMSVDIPVIEQEVPSHLDVHLLDKSYVARWINIMPQRLGVCLAQGYTYVTKEDFDPRFPIVLNFDTSGNYSCGDVVCLKIPKERYYPAIRANYNKTMSIHGKSVLYHAIASGKATVQLDKQGNEILGGLNPINPSGVQFYDPGMDSSKGEHEITREMVS